MPALETFLPRRRAELVSWPAASPEHYLVRNRRTGETFQLGQEEAFLLARLDGRSSAEDVCDAFADRFGEPLSPPELAAFLDLAGQRGFLQADGAAAAPLDRGGLPDRAPAPQSAGPALSRQAASRLLAAGAAALRWLGACLGAAGQRLDWFRLRRLDYLPRPDDIFIVTYPRSGTTWLQMILYQLTTDGSMDVPHIAEYCPWFEKSQRSANGFDTRPSPRLFKSHLAYRDVPKGPGKYIYVARDGRDVAVSYYHLYRAYNGYGGTFPEFFERFLDGHVGYGSWFRHVKGWWAHRHDLNVLFLTYEELTRDLEACVRQIIAFCGLEVPPERLPAILERCRFTFMKQHESQFDPALETLWEQGVTLHSFLRSGRIGEGAIRLSPEQEGRFTRAFARRLGPSGIALGRNGKQPH
jgi:hypothetical protein